MPPGRARLQPPLVYLASQSPRRRALLTQIGVPFAHLAVEVDESPRSAEPPRAYVARLAVAKARAGVAAAGPGPGMPVLGADTSVVLDGAILGKPAGEAAARGMLSALSGRTHQVLSAVALAHGAREEVAVSVSTVRMRRLAPAEIDAYVATGEPLDKAGAYGIQGLGGAFVAELKGSYSGVMGLPLCETTGLLETFGIPWLSGP